MNSIIYARQSSGDEEFSESIEIQIKNCKILATQNDFDLKGIYSDANISGKTYPNLQDAIHLSKSDRVYQDWLLSLNDAVKTGRYRQGLAELLNNLPSVDFIIVDDFTRIMRPLTNSFLEPFLIQKLRQYQIKILTVKNGLVNLESFSDTLVMSLQNQVNDNQLSIQRKKSKDALIALKNSGYRASGTNFRGYNYSGRQTVAIVEREAECVKEIFRLANNGTPYTRICKIINDKFSLDLKYREVIKVLSRPEYAGYQYNTERELIASNVFNGKELITYEDFLQAKQRLAGTRRIINRDKNNTYAFSGLVFCGCCGSRLMITATTPMKNSHEKKKIHMFSCLCRLYKTTKSACGLCAIRYQYETSNLYGLYESLMPLVLIEGIRQLKTVAANKSMFNELEKINNELEKFNVYEKNLDTLLFEGVLSKNEYKDKIIVHKEQKNILLHKKEELTNNSVIDVKDIKSKILCLFGDIKHHNLDHSVYKDLAQKVFEKIIVFPYHIEIHFNSGESVSLERVCSRNSRSLPKWTLLFPYNEIRDLDEHSKLCLAYQYKTFDLDIESQKLEKKILLDNENICIYTLGRNNRPYEYLEKKKRWKRLAASKKRLMMIDYEKTGKGALDKSI